MGKDALGWQARNCLQFSVACAEHGRKPGHFHFAPTFFAWLFKMTMVPDLFQNAFTIDALFQAPQSFLNGLTLFQFNFGQTDSLPLLAWQIAAAVPPPCLSFLQAAQSKFASVNVNPQNGALTLSARCRRRLSESAADKWEERKRDPVSLAASCSH